MEESKREEIALFRYSIILPFLSQDELEWGVKGEMLRRLADQNYTIPNSDNHSIDEETIRKWLAKYKKKGFDGLKPKPRSDMGKPRAISPEAWEKAAALKKEAPNRSVRKVIRIMEANGLIQTGQIKQSTLARHFKEHGLDRKSLAKSPQVFRRFEAERPNQIWQSDILYGPYLPDPKQPEKNKRTYLVAFIDDFSRLVLHAEFYWDEKFPALENTFKKGMLKRGVPESVYVDNGQVYSARRLDAVCAALGIRKISCKPYSPEGKGKIERFFGTVRSNFLDEPEVTKTQTLPELNRLFWGWLEVEYHNRKHGTTGVAPLVRWRESIGNFLRTVDEKELAELFLWQVTRTVTKVGLVMVQGIEFEVDAIFKSKKVEVRFNPFDLSFVHIYHAGNFVQKAKPAKLSRWNSAAKANQKTPASPKGTTGIKPLKQLAGQHKEQKQQQARELIGKPANPKRNDETLTLPQFIHMLATSLEKKPETLHTREVEALQDFWGVWQPLSAEGVGIAMAKAVLKHGMKQHIDVYLQAIKTLHLKSNSEKKS
ncbi:MAG: DDE-type integrase/transposase/recombinase [bacterium]